MGRKVEKLAKIATIELIQKANEVKRKEVVDKIWLASIYNAKSEICSEDCKFCSQSKVSSADMILTLEELGVDGIPIKGTSLENAKPILIKDVLEFIAITRLVLRDKMITMCADRERLKEFQALAFLAGVNEIIIGDYLTTRGQAIEEDQ